MGLRRNARCAEDSQGKHGIFCYWEMTDSQTLSLSLGGGWRAVEIVHAVRGAVPFVSPEVRGVTRGLLVLLSVALMTGERVSQSVDPFWDLSKPYSFCTCPLVDSSLSLLTDHRIINQHPSPF